jgi:hypothetical protein
MPLPEQRDVVAWHVPASLLASARICVGDSVYEDAQVTVKEGWLHIEFDADDLDNISLEMSALTNEGRS